MSETLKTRYKIALFQMASGEDLEVNCRKVEEHLADLKKADLVVLPEMWPFLIPDARGEERYSFSLKHHKALVEQMRGWARETEAFWVGGSIFTPDQKSEKVLNTCIVLSPEGKECGSYTKMHLFDNLLAPNQFCESKTVSAGHYQKPIELGESLNLGLSICYDLRFPYHFQALSDHGANVIVVPAAFTYKTGEAHWEILLRARAIENQCYILACNQTTGGVEGVNCWGHSMVIDPWGQIVAGLKHEEGLLWAEMDLDQVNQTRAKMPVLSHRLFTLGEGLYDPKS